MGKREKKERKKERKKGRQEKIRKVNKHDKKDAIQTHAGPPGKKTSASGAPNRPGGGGATFFNIAPA